MKKKSLSRAVFDQLTEQILRGTLSPGESLPGERSLSEVLGVNRGAVREALKRLEQARLVMIQQGGATTVLDYVKSAGLDVLAQLVLTGEQTVDLRVVLSLMELRSALGPDIVRRCALRRSESLVEELRVAMGVLEDAASSEDERTANFELWQLLVTGSHNVSYQLAFNTLRHCWSSVSELVREVLAEELSQIEKHRALIHAVEEQDAERAADIAKELVVLSEDEMARRVEPYLSEGTRYVGLEDLIEESHDE